MTQEEKQLLIKDLCARLPYGVKYCRDSWNYEWDQEMSVVEVLEDIDKDGYINYHKVYKVNDIKPYLRSMSSMTEEEKGEYFNSYDWEYFEEGTPFDWLSAHHFDYRGLIKKGLALEAPEGMYKTGYPGHYFYDGKRMYLCDSPAMEEKQKERKSVPFSCGHENGKSAEWDELQAEFRSINEAFEDGKKEVIDHPDKYGLTKQKPVERSLEDDHIIGFVYDLLNEIEWKDNWAMSKEECLRLLNNYSPQKPEKYKIPDFVFSKQEYESHPIISEDTTSVKPVELDGKTLLYTADKSYQIGFRDGVASVKPAEWSEEDERKRNGLIKGLEDRMGFGWACDPFSREEYIDWLKSLRPSWKPSEEQIEALKNSAYGTYQNGDGPALRELYQQLKKLM